MLWNMCGHRRICRSQFSLSNKAVVSRFDYKNFNLLSHTAGVLVPTPFRDKSDFVSLTSLELVM